MKYFCEHCGRLLDEEEIDRYKWADRDGTEGEDWLCPYCKSPYIGEAQTCDICGDYVVISTKEDYYPEENYRSDCICSDCAEAIDKEFISMFKACKVNTKLSLVELSKRFFDRAEQQYWYEEKLREADRELKRLQNAAKDNAMGTRG